MLVDVIIAILLISIILRGRETGLVRQVGAALGFVAGLFIGAFLQPHIVGLADTTLSRAMLSLLATLGGAFLFMNIGEYLGSLLKRRIQHLMPLDKADAVLGSLAGAITLLGGVWLITPLISGLPAPGIQQALKESSIVGSLARILPSAPDVISRIDHAINPNGFPDVFAGLDRTPQQTDAPLPNLGDLQTAVQQTRPSVIKMEGRGCGGIVEGSGFVAAKNIVVTNAHVIAGVKQPTIIDTAGRHDATPIWFDSELDVAVLRTTGLVGGPLTIDTAIAPNDTPAVVVGYPGGGGFTAKPATILDQLSATGRDIYGKKAAPRDMYEVKADIIPGNSGGPLLNKAGQVIGLVFAQSTTYDQVGYALTMQNVAKDLQQAIQQNSTVGTGPCAG